MSGNVPPVKFGFYDPFEVYPKIQHDLATKVHLTNLHWRKAANESLRSIPSLPFTLIEETPRIFDNNVSGQIANISGSKTPLEDTLKLLQAPYARLMFFRCDGVETYRAQVRPLIKVWKEQNIDTANGPIDWYLIYYVTSETDIKSSQRIFEKLKVDFPDSRNIERLIKLKSSYVSSVEETETWNSLSSKLKNGALFSFSNKLQILYNAVLSENIDPILSITLKEGIARQFLTLHLFEDALGEYDHLQAFISQHLSAFERYGTTLDSLDHFVQLPRLLEGRDQRLTQFDLKSYVFAKQFIVLEALSDNAASLSIASLHISEFLKRLELFILDVSSSIGDSGMVNEWIYKTINDVLTLEICVKIIDTENDDESLSQISERFGELLLLQRSKLLSIGTAYGYHIDGVLTDLLINDTTAEIHYQPLREVLATRETFEEKYITLTEAAIKHFSVSGRPRAVDALSIDIALLDYQNGEYSKAALVLSNCPEFYGAEGWDFIGYHLLETYIDCLENIEGDSDFFDKPKESLLASNYALLLSSTKANQNIPKKDLSDTYEKLLKLKPTEPIKFPLNKIFDIDVTPFIRTDPSGSYELEIALKNSLPFDTLIENITLTLINEDEQIIRFTGKSSTITGETRIALETNHIIFGSFKILNVQANIGPVTISHDFGSINEVLIYPSLFGPWLKVSSSTNMKLDSKTFSLFIETKEDVIDLAAVSFIPLSDLDIDFGSIEVFERSNIIDSNQENHLTKVNHMEPNTPYEVVVPYTPDPKAGTINISINFQYTINNRSFSQTFNSTIDSALSIAVSVQDIYRENGLYSNFTIGTADANLPIRILDVDLRENEKYKVKNGLKPEGLITFAEQPANYFFKIEKLEDSAYEDSDSLNLDIEYRDLVDEVRRVGDEILFCALEKENLESYWRLLSGTKFSDFDYQSYVVDSKVRLLEPSTFRWDILRAIPPSDRKRVHEILKCLLKGTPSVVPVDFPSKHLHINVPIPQVKVIHTVELKIKNDSIHTTLGSEILVELKVRSVLYSKQQTGERSGRKKVSFKGDDSNQYFLEILANQDTWLVDGKTKFSFEVDELQDYESSNLLTFIPLKVGKITLPKIKITNEASKHKSEYSMEIDYKNDNETIYVVSE